MSDGEKTTIESLTVQVKEILTRLQSLERNQKDSADEPKLNSNDTDDSHSAYAESSLIVNNPVKPLESEIDSNSAGLTADSSDLQSSYAEIKKSVQNVKIPKGTFNVERTGIK
ncbi:hypothetical protein SNE40_013132 [Patella caerulea]|uniref:Uncharacterized protein n=1 Tax=Patella caerulea TaxID=87958 RepID=A0AAN8PNF2_PATCE